jgi:hypothetical protein
MRPKSVILASILVLLGAAAPPASAGPLPPQRACSPAYWGGNWDTSSGAVHYGVVHFQQAEGSDVVTGNYTFTPNGHIVATASGNRDNGCTELNGTWRDDSGSGTISVTLDMPDTGSFSGTSTRSGSSKTYPWSGKLFGN